MDISDLFPHGRAIVSRDDMIEQLGIAPLATGRIAASHGIKRIGMTCYVRPRLTDYISFPRSTALTNSGSTRSDG